MTMEKDRFEAAKRRLDEPRATTFRFEKAGDEIIGKVVRLDIASTEYGEARIVVVDPGNGELRSIWLFHDALISQMEKIRPGPGDVIAVRYHGLVMGTNGRKYHNYSVSSDKDTPQFSWGPKPVELQPNEPNPFHSDVEDDEPGF
jgi:hypothetical protein